MHRVFISYHHKNENHLKDELLRLNSEHNLFIDCSVSTGDVDENMEPQAIRQTIRRNYLSGSTVLLLLVGRETKYRKHVDWELYSSMYNGTNFGKSGVVVLHAPDSESDYFTAPFDEVKRTVYPGVSSWTSISDRQEYERRYPHLPDRIIDNLVKGKSKISVTNWSKIAEDPDRLRLLIDCAHNSLGQCEYDMSRGMRMRDHNPSIF
ncbi:MAG TPA: hypothetical protein DCX68_15265 [Marinobacter hydrocarbonoclasticus]|mgnify:CR=1 FL=1|nr:hypothetical protein [Alcanivorax sp.]MAY09243.1 hypothetical protein [Alcanivorax sp.]MBI56489.1 hypothetical protein [Alcanivorax sp.]HAX11392.1 hypothetical protein [Marinobacter nauticus]|tara:strand:+ start:1294 stop:1914 length:621 start_codon:yes stop_codon:yes gene_type:complete